MSCGEESPADQALSHLLFCAGNPPACAAAAAASSAADGDSEGDAAELPWRVGPLNWRQLLYAVCSEAALSPASRLWLFERSRCSGGASARQQAVVAEERSAPLLDALAGAAPLPGLSAAAPSFAADRLPQARARGCCA
jgi:hypothetical protein